MIRKILAFFVVLLLVNSATMTLAIIHAPRSEHSSLSALRFYVLLGVHALIIIAFFTSASITGFYQTLVLVCLTSAISVLLMTACLGITERMKVYYHYGEQSASGHFQMVQHIEEIVFDVLYFVGLVWLFGTSVYLLTCLNRRLADRGKQVTDYRDSLSVRPFSKEMEGSECPICLEEMKSGEEEFYEVKVCGHVFHSVCLLGWLENKRSCPICRKEIIGVELEEVDLER